MAKGISMRARLAAQDQIVFAIEQMMSADGWSGDQIAALRQQANRVRKLFDMPVDEVSEVSSDA